MSPGLHLFVDVEVAEEQVLEIGLKTGEPGNSSRENFEAFLLSPNRIHVPSVAITGTYELTEIDFVIQGSRNCDPSTDVCDPMMSTFWVRDPRLGALPQVLFDFEMGIDPPIVEGGQETVVTRPESSENDVLEFAWSFDRLPEERDPFVVLTFDGISVGPCDRLVADLEVAERQTVRFEAKTPEAIVRDTRTREMRPGSVEEIEIAILTRFALGEVAFVIERDLNEDTAGAGLFWVDNIRLLRGE